MKNRFLAFLAAICMTVATAVPGYAGVDLDRSLIDGPQLNMSVPPGFAGGQKSLPAEGASEKGGCTVERIVTAEGDIVIQKSKCCPKCPSGCKSCC